MPEKPLNEFGGLDDPREDNNYGGLGFDPRRHDTFYDDGKNAAGTGLLNEKQGLKRDSQGTDAARRQMANTAAVDGRPAVGQLWTVDEVTFRWNGKRWVQWHTEPQDIVIGRYGSLGVYEDLLSSYGSQVIGASAHANVNGGIQTLGSSWAVMQFPHIPGYRRHYQMVCQFYYETTAGVTGSNLRIYMRHQGVTEYYVPYNASRNSIPWPDNNWGSGQFDVDPNNAHNVDNDAFLVGCQTNITDAASAHVHDGWLDVEDDIPNAIDDGYFSATNGVDAHRYSGNTRYRDAHRFSWTAYVQFLGNAAGGSWRPVFREVVNVGRYVPEDIDEVWYNSSGKGLNNQ